MNVVNAFLIVGLGNPGAQYNNTRHNLGFRTLDILAERAGIKFTQRLRTAHLGQGVIAGHDVILAKPQTFMNLSGQAVQSLFSKYGFKREQLIVISDDFNLPLGRLRIRKSGGPGGHNGIRNIIECIGSQDFARVRLGMGSAPPGRDPIDFVLGSFPPDEYEAINTLIATGAEAVEFIIEHGLDPAMNSFNGK